MDDKVFVIRGFDYDEDIRLEDGQVFRLLGYPADIKLRNAKMVQDVEDAASVRKCDGCGKEFLNDHFLARHRTAKHAPKDMLAKAARARAQRKPGPMDQDDDT